MSIVQPGAYPGTELGSADPIGADQARAAGYGPLAGALQGFVARAQAARTDPSAPDPQQVADALVALVESESGQRPVRVYVDAQKGPFAPRLNEAHAQVQRELLTAVGMGLLAD